MKNFLEQYKKSIGITLVVAVLLNILAIGIFDIPLKNENTPYGIVSYELAKDLNQSINILNSWNEHAKINAGLSMGFDFLFLLVYSSLIAFIIYNFKNDSLKKYNKIFIYSIFFAAFLDAIENIALIKLLLGDLLQIWSSIAFYFTSLKFVLVFICIIYILINWILFLFKKRA